MPSPLMRMSLARPGACIAPKNMVRARPPSARSSPCGWGETAGCVPPTVIGAPQAPQKRKLGATSAPQVAQMRLSPDAAAGAGAAARLRCTGTIPRDSPQAWQAVAFSGESASQASQTRPMVIVRQS